MKKSCYLFFFLLLAGGFTLNAQTHVGGALSGNTTWTKANSPYIVDQTIIVYAGDTLTLQPGTEVRFKAGREIYLQGGALLAHGNALDSIYFNADSATNNYSGGGGGILMEYASAYTALSFVSICDADHALGGQGYKRTIIKNSSFRRNRIVLDGSGFYARFDSCYFAQNDHALDDFPQNIRVFNSKFEYNQVAVITCDSVINCIFLHNGEALMGAAVAQNCVCKYNNIGAAGPPLVFLCNEITDNNIGLKCGNAATVQKGNKICHNLVYNVQMLNMFDRTLKNICWCETDSAAIAAKIFDGKDSSALGDLSFIPFISCGSGTSVDSLCSLQPTGIFQPGEKTPLKAYPNPMSTFTSLSLDQHFLGADISVFNTLGQEVQDLGKTQSTDITIYRRDLPAGLYFIVVSKAGSSQSIKLMITD